jgi:hypothetical protein
MGIGRSHVDRAVAAPPLLAVIRKRWIPARSWIVLYIPVYTTIHDHSDGSTGELFLAVIQWGVGLGETGAIAHLAASPLLAVISCWRDAAPVAYAIDPIRTLSATPSTPIEDVDGVDDRPDPVNYAIDPIAPVAYAIHTNRGCGWRR